MSYYIISPFDSIFFVFFSSQVQVQVQVPVTAPACPGYKPPPDRRLKTVLPIKHYTHQFCTHTVTKVFYRKLLFA